MNATQTIKGLFHRPVRVRVQYPGATKEVVGFIEDEEEFDGFEQEVKRMIQLQGMLSPQFDAVALEAWD
jgi:molybdopterin converting factor small subunit